MHVWLEIELHLKKYILCNSSWVKIRFINYSYNLKVSLSLYAVVPLYFRVNSGEEMNTIFSACSWWTGEWSECSRSCNGGLRTREVLCKRRISGTEEKVLDDSTCAPLRPSLTKPCSNHTCPPEWLALDWSEVDICCNAPLQCRF